MKKTELAHTLIDLVEDAIRKAHPDIEKIVSEGQYCENCERWLFDYEKKVHHHTVQKPNTLLYGEDYYNLENDVVEALDTTRVKVSGETTDVMPDYILRLIEDQFKIRMKLRGVDWNDEDIMKLRKNTKYRIEAMMREKGTTFCKTSIRKWGRRAR